MINPAAQAHHRVAMRPRNSQSRVPIVIPWMEKRVGTGAVAAPGAEIKRNINVVSQVKSIEKVEPDARRDGQIAGSLPFVLNISPILRLALPYQTKNRGVGS